MNILFLSLSFSTKNHKSFYEDLLRVFQKNGDSIYVACANEKRSQEPDGIEDNNGIIILRIRTGNITGNISLIEKGISTVTIDGLFEKAIKKKFGSVKFDLIMYPTPPITLVNTIESVKSRTGAKAYLLLKDIFPQNAIDLGMMKKTGVKGLLYRYFRNKEKKLYRISDYIGCMSPANCEYVLMHNTEVEKEKVEVCPNCVLPSNSQMTESELDEIRKKYDVPIDKKVFIYGGNLGKPQGIKFFLQCMERCKTINEAFFLIVGGGSEENHIKRFIEENNIKNAKILRTLPKKDYQLLASSCDVGLVFLDYRFTIPNFPSRILSYMQTSKPVIVASDPCTDMGNIVEENKIGWKCMSNDSDAFVRTVQKAVKADLKKMGAQGRKYLLDNYDVKDGYEIIMKHFNEK